MLFSSIGQVELTSGALQQLQPKRPKWPAPDPLPQLEVPTE